MVLFLLFIVACKPNETDGPDKDTKDYPRFSDISILESVKEEGAIDVFVKALDTDASVHLIVVEKDAKAPTHEEIKKHEAYSGVNIVSYLEGTGTLYKTIQGLEQAKVYDIYVTLFKNNLYAKEFYKTRIEGGVYGRTSYDSGYCQRAWHFPQHSLKGDQQHRHTG